MNNIEKLIQKLCPNGVEVKELGEVCEFQRGTSITFKDVIEGDVPVIAGGQNPSYYHNTPNRTGETIAVSGSGAYAGFVSYWTIPIFMSDSFSVNPDKDLLMAKYVYYFLKKNQVKIHDTKKGSGVPHVYGSSIAKFQIPAPPLPVQKEIVDILDKFTKLEAELEAELEARLTQYEYYRNELLNFEGKDVEWKTLGEVCTFEYGKSLKEADRKGGVYPVMGSNGIVGYHNTFFIQAPSIIIGRKGSAGAINWVDLNCYPIDTTFYIKLKTDNLNLKFLFYYLLNVGLSPETQQGGVPGLNRNDAYIRKIPIPSISEQERIVGILDKFDALVNDIKVGLPAEIEARKKQYEYYREKLLTFTQS